MKAIGDRMKANYELRARRELIRRMPVIVRVDGKAFHTYTRGLARPFDSGFISAMVTAAKAVGEEMQGFKAGYIQSDEASFFLTDYDTFQTSAWFDYSQSKIETICASVMTAAFNRAMGSTIDAHFDARAFNVPKEEVSNYFLWRAMDWERNSLSMYCNSFFSHKQMHGKCKADQHEMLHLIGKNWTTDLDCRLRNGTWIFAGGSERTNIIPSYEVIDASLHPLIYCSQD
jgi:tRNA(His) guanylyltransferase